MTFDRSRAYRGNWILPRETTSSGLRPLYWLHQPDPHPAPDGGPSQQDTSWATRSQVALLSNMLDFCFQNDETTDDRALYSVLDLHNHLSKALGFAPFDILLLAEHKDLVWPHLLGWCGLEETSRFIQNLKEMKPTVNVKRMTRKERISRLEYMENLSKQYSWGEPWEGDQQAESTGAAVVDSGTKAPPPPQHVKATPPTATTKKRKTPKLDTCGKLEGHRKKRVSKAKASTLAKLTKQMEESESRQKNERRKVVESLKRKRQEKAEKPSSNEPVSQKPRRVESMQIQPHQESISSRASMKSPAARKSKSAQIPNTPKSTKSKQRVQPVVQKPARKLAISQVKTEPRKGSDRVSSKKKPSFSLKAFAAARPIPKKKRPEVTNESLLDSAAATNRNTSWLKPASTADSSISMRVPRKKPKPVDNTGRSKSLLATEATASSISMRVPRKKPKPDTASQSKSLLATEASKTTSWGQPSNLEKLMASKTISWGRPSNIDQLMASKKISWGKPSNMEKLMASKTISWGRPSTIDQLMASKRISWGRPSDSGKLKAAPEAISEGQPSQLPCSSTHSASGRGTTTATTARRQSASASRMSASDAFAGTPSSWKHAPDCDKKPAAHERPPNKQTLSRGVNTTAPTSNCQDWAPRCWKDSSYNSNGTTVPVGWDQRTKLPASKTAAWDNEQLESNTQQSAGGNRSTTLPLGRGRGRTMPAWKTSGQANQPTTGIASAASAPPLRPGRGRTLPALKTSKQANLPSVDGTRRCASKSGTATTLPPQPSLSASTTTPRGRGRGMTLPAWLTSSLGN